MTSKNQYEPSLKGLRVLDCASLFAGPVVAAILGDFGADVIKIEHPTGDALRQVGQKKDGVPLWWKVVSRNKRCITLDLKSKDGSEIFKKLVAGADVVIENFRTGTMERWGLGWDTLSKINPRLVMVRITGFGQTGPMKTKAGFGTLAEAFSGFAHITGEADGPPTLPPFGLADGVAAHYGVFSTMFALYERDAKGSGLGQFIDVSLYEPMFALLGYQPTLFDQTGMVQGRTGNRSINNAPRNTYRTKDQQWVALSAAAPSIVRRVLVLTGGQEAANDPRFLTAESRIEHVEEIDAIVGGWIAMRTQQQVLQEFERAQAAVAPVYSVDQIFDDPQYRARNDIVDIADEELGTIRLQNAFPFMSRTPGEVRFAGPRLGQHNREILGDEIGLSDAEIDRLRQSGAI